MSEQFTATSDDEQLVLVVFHPADEKQASFDPQDPQAAVPGGTGGGQPLRGHRERSLAEVSAGGARALRDPASQPAHPPACA